MCSTRTIDQVFRQMTEQFSEKTALIYEEEKYSFAELNQLVEQLAGALYAHGIGKQDKVIIYLPHLPESIITWLSLQRLGAVPIPVSHFYEHQFLHYIVNDCQVETMVCTPANFHQVKKAAANTGLKRIILVDCQDVSEQANQLDSKSIQLLGFDHLIQAPASSLPAVAIESGEIAEILYTSGTTGLPKGVPIYHQYFIEQITQARDLSEPVIARGQGVTIQGAPLNHVLGQELGLGSLLSGDCLILLPQLNLDLLLEHIEKYQATTFFGTQTLLRMILEHENLDQFQLNSLVYVFTGGEALPAEVARKWLQKFGNPIYQGYGCTECCGAITGLKAAEPFPEGTVGKIVPNKKYKLVNAETLEPVAKGEAGELLVYAEHMTKSYWQSPEETAKRFLEFDQLVWFRTGDIVENNEDGWVFFKERSVDMIKHKGYRVAPSKIEGVLYRHEAVSSCCVVGVPDLKVGEKIKAFVVLKAGAGNVSADDLINWCKDKLVSYEIPHFIEFRSDLPKSPTGKILRKVLREQELAKTAG
ncbi:MAG TPA: AMP-binding protein [Limnochordia bacterium]|nr:AMP-binding protein [Limnochordia bacterium]